MEQFVNVAGPPGPPGPPRGTLCPASGSRAGVGERGRGGGRGEGGGEMEGGGGGRGGGEEGGVGKVKPPYRGKGFLLVLCIKEHDMDYCMRTMFYNIHV